MCALPAPPPTPVALACVILTVRADLSCSQTLHSTRIVQPATSRLGGQQCRMPLLVHGEVTAAHVDFFDREKLFIQQKLAPLLQQLPSLRMVLEHITTRDAADFVASAPDNVAATITPQHMLLNRNSLFGVRLSWHAVPVHGIIREPRTCCWKTFACLLCIFTGQ